EKKLGKCPATLKELLTHFSGAELFISGIPLLTFFRISNDPPLSHLEWAPEWHIDQFTVKWRAAGSERKNDWAIAMTNYGGLILLDKDETVTEWDTGEARWLVKDLPFDEWIEKIMKEGEAIMAEET